MTKHLTFLMILLMCAAGCTNKSSEYAFSIDGTAENCADGDYLYLIAFDDNNSPIADSALVTDGKFSFSGLLSAPVECRLLTDSFPLKRGARNSARLYLEGCEMTLAVEDVASLKDAVLTGSETQAEMDDLNSKIGQYNEPLLRLNDEFYKVRAAGDTVRLAEIQKEAEELGRKYREVEGDWLSEHPMSYYAFESKSHSVSMMDLESVDSLFNAFPEKFIGTKAYKSIEKELNNLKKSAPGAPATDFSDTDINGEEFTLSSLKGHYIILDFWASWCGPCRASMPHVIALYEKYRDQGLEVVCVADNDSQPDKWKAAVEEDGTQAFHHVLRGLKRSENGDYDKSEDKDEDYAIHYIPTKYLIDPDFNIVGKLNDEELDAKLQEVFGF